MTDPVSVVRKLAIAIALAAAVCFIIVSLTMNHKFAKTLLLATTMLAATPVCAANIYRSGYQAVEIKGNIVAGDFDNFGRVVGAMNVGQVRIYLDSPGGSLVEGFRIGILIHELGYATVAHNMCVSSCANIWLAGSQRWVIPGARIGFHRTFTKSKIGNKETRKTDPQGEALQRKYYADIGYTNQNGIDWMLSAGAWDMNWLGDDNGRKYNITFGFMSAQAPVLPVRRSTGTEEQQVLNDPKWLGKHDSPVFQRAWRGAQEHDKYMHWQEQYD
jgi:hypothetical protein